jgi:tripartite-type tricarboxylate transporter receptor subunit TctC
MAKRHVVAIWLASLALTPASAEEFPNRPITWVVPFAPGGITDTTSRIGAEEMSRTLGQSVVIDNRAGGGGTVGTEQVARSKPDDLRHPGHHGGQCHAAQKPVV